MDRRLPLPVSTTRVPAVTLLARMGCRYLSPHDLVQRLQSVLTMPVLTFEVNAMEEKYCLSPLLQVSPTTYDECCHLHEEVVVLDDLMRRGISSTSGLRKSTTTAHGLP